MRRLPIWIAVLSALVLPGSAVAQETWTLLPGVLTVDGARPSIGIAFGYALSPIVGFEVEYLGTLGPRTAGHSSGGAILGGIIVHPAKIGQVQYFVIGGIGHWSETLANGNGIEGVGAKHVGGGIKVWMTNYFALRLDYRLLLIGTPKDVSRAPTTRHRQRLSAGLHFEF